MPMVIEKTRVNLFNAAGFLVTVFGVGVVWATLNGNVSTAQKDVTAVQSAVQEIRENQVLRAQITDRNNTEQRQTLSAVPQLQFNYAQQQREIADIKKSVDATNAKVDRFMELLNAKLDAIGENVNGLRVDVRVMNASQRNGEDKRPGRP